MQCVGFCRHGPRCASGFRRSVMSRSKPCETQFWGKPGSDSVVINSATPGSKRSLTISRGPLRFGKGIRTLTRSRTGFRYATPWLLTSTHIGLQTQRCPQRWFPPAFVQRHTEAARLSWAVQKRAQMVEALQSKRRKVKQGRVHHLAPERAETREAEESRRSWVRQ